MIGEPAADVSNVKGTNHEEHIKVHLYPNECVRRVIAFIPPNHYHLRMIIELPDQIIILHEAVIAAMLRAYIDITTHPKRRAIELVIHKLERDEKKPGYARWQLLETSREESEILREAMGILSRAEKMCCDRTY